MLDLLHLNVWNRNKNYKRTFCLCALSSSMHTNCALFETIMWRSNKCLWLEHLCIRINQTFASDINEFNATRLHSVTHKICSNHDPKLKLVLEPKFNGFNVTIFNSRYEKNMPKIHTVAYLTISRIPTFSTGENGGQSLRSEEYKEIRHHRGTNVVCAAYKMRFIQKGCIDLMRCCWVSIKMS